MSYLNSKRRELAKKFVSAGLAVTTFAWLLGVPSAGAATTAETIATLLAQIQSLQSQLVALQGGSGSTGAAACSFTRSLSVGAKGDDVTCLQGYLKSAGHFSATPTGYFGNVTKAAVQAWQKANGVSAVGIFGPASKAKYTAVAGSTTGATTGTTTGTTPTTPTTTAPAGTGLTVAAASDQPAAGLFGESFASRPFTKVNFTASADGDITVKSVTIERTGQAQDAVFSGVILLDENGIRIGTAKTLNSNHQAVLNEPITVKAGTTKAITVAGDSDNNQDAYAGQVATLTVVAVDAGSATVNGTLPITGNGMTVNATLAVGTITLSRGTRDPGTSATKQVGTTDYIFSALKLTAASTENMTVKSIRWNQSGSAAIGDLAKIKVYVDSTSDAYDVAVSSDGKYYTATLGSGLKIAKGEHKELYIKGDVVSGSARTVDFDLYRYADIQAKGDVYGYDTLPTATEVAASADDGNFHSAQPNFDAFQVTIDNGTMNVENATSVAATNIAVNLSGQVLGGFSADVKGESISVASMNFDVSTTEAAGTGGAIDSNDITNISLYDGAGNVVAGPVDGVAGGNNGIQFTDTVTFPVGKNTYTLKGKLGTDFLSNDTVIASTTPGSDWGTVKGVTTGNTVTPTPATAVTLSTMTVKSAALTVSVSPTPSAQNIVAGVNSFLFTNYIFDASASGEDIRITTFYPEWEGDTNEADDLTNCTLYDGATALNTGGNVVNPANTVSNADDQVFNLDSGFIVPKGTIKTVGLKCNLRASPDAATDGTDDIGWGIENNVARIVSSGMTSGQTFSETITASTGSAMTVRSGGSLSLVLDSSSPALKWVQAGATDQTLAVFRVNSTYEDVTLSTIGLQMASSTNAGDAMASNTPSDISKVSLWNNAKKIGEATFTSTDYATTTFSTQFGATEADYTVIKDTQILITVKADIGTIGVTTNAFPGHLALVNYDASNSSNCNAGVNTSCQRGLVGIGKSSGTKLSAGGSDTASNGARIAKAVPTVERVGLTSTKFSNTTGNTLYKFKVTAPAGTNGISLYKFTFLVSTSVSGYLQEFQVGPDASDPPVSDFRVDGYQVYCYSDLNFSQPSCGNSNNSGLLNDAAISDFSTIASTTSATLNDQSVSITFNPANPTSATAEAVVIPAGDTRYFVLKGDVTGASSTPSITTKMQGDAQFASLNDNPGAQSGNGASNGGDITIMGDSYSTGRYVFATTASLVDAWDDDDFIWSGNSTNTSQSVSSYDWFNGFLVPGLSNSDAGVVETLTLN